ncbi:MAG: hypothetical protein KC877_02525 [Candidatus Kaiserbacteria bacterium]|nr:hypothetical protein [Candidatus Kaiserbacteria bacterium]MCB9816443.1 hypothetical protein [Candidatus Nomurabacteria bacterium]
MINLIPPRAKKGLLVEYWVRVISVWMTTWAFTLLLGAAIVLPAYVLISSQVSVYEESAAEASRKVENYESVSVALVQASQQARVIIDEAKYEPMSDLLALFEEMQGNDINLTTIILERSATAEGFEPVTLTGIAADRHSLASFRDRLLAVPEVDDVELPISNLAEDRDIRFTITVTFKEV